MAHAQRKELNTEGLHKDRPSSISTWTGRRVEPLALKASDVSIYDIAHALARQCRYNGHCFGHLSVARHSIWVSGLVETWTKDRHLALHGLLHDAAEAYLGDMVRPLKASPQMAAFRIADGKADRTLAEAFGLEFPQPDVITEADRFVLNNTELSRPGGARFSYDGDYREDEREFLARFNELKEEARVSA